MRVPSFLVLVATSLPLAYADVKFTAPDAGAIIGAGSPFLITWVDGGNTPSLHDASLYTLVLYSGSNSSPFPVTTLIASGDPSSGSANVTIEAELGESITDAYFLGMTTTVKAGGEVINYSHRFTISEMTGSFTDDLKAALSQISGTAGPVDVLPTDNTGSRLEIRQAALPFNEQVGPTRYAPMQSVPGTSITAQNTSPLFPTSSVAIATTFLATPTVQTTLTAAQTNVVPSQANTAAAAPQPSNDMAKYLNRWKD